MSTTYFKPTTSMVVWIATALLHMENQNKKDFQPKEIFQKVKELGILKTSDATLRTHISYHCVANLPPRPNKDRILYKENGRYRLYKAHDNPDPGRQGGKIAPKIDEIPPQFRNTLHWYLTNYYNKISDADDRLDPNAGIFYSEVKENDFATIPQGIMKILKPKRGEPLLFVFTKDGRIEVKKPQP